MTGMADFLLAGTLGDLRGHVNRFPGHDAKRAGQGA